MYRPAVAALAALTLLSVPRPSPAGEGGDAFLARVAARYGSIRSLAASFRQEVPLRNVGIVRRASGRVWFARPLKMRWNYEAPDDQLFLADGSHLYFRPPGSRQVFRRTIDEGALGGKVPILLLFGKGDAAALFRVEEMLPRKGGEETALRLVPRGGGAPEVRRIDLVVGTGDLLVREVHLYDRLGGANHLYLEKVELDPEIPAGFFRFRGAPGVEVVDG